MKVSRRNDLLVLAFLLILCAIMLAFMLTDPEAREFFSQLFIHDCPPYVAGGGLCL